MSVYSRSALVSLAVAAALGQISTSASAQALEEVVVTARKTQESLQDAPVAVSAVTSQAIQELGIRNINDLANMTSGLSFSKAFGRTTDRPVIRGQSNVLAGVQFGVESGVAYFVDGVYWPGDIQGLDMNSMERVEVIKGPQSALYGRNTYSGAINFIVAPPTEDVEAYVKASLAQYGEQDYAFSVGSSFWDDKVGARFYARSYNYDGQYKNTLTNHLVGAESTQSAGMYLTWKPIEDLKFASNLIYREDDDGPLALFLTSANKNNCKPGYRSTYYRDPPGAATRGADVNQYYCGVIPPGIVALNTDALPPSAANPNGVPDGTAFDGVQTSEYFGTLRGDWNIVGSGWTLTSLTGYRSYDNKFGTDSDHSAVYTAIPSYNPLGGGFQISQNKEPLFANTNRDIIRSTSQEVRVSTPQDKFLRAMVGYYWYDYTDRGKDLTFYDPSNGDRDYTETVNDNSVFGMVSWDIVKGVTLNAEIRYQQETKERWEYCSTAASTGDYNPFTNSCTNWGPAMRPGMTGFYNKPLGTVNYHESADFNSTTPRITLDWQINDNNMVYVVYAQGAKPGGLNGIAGQTIGLPTYKQETSDNWEIGNKWTAWENRFRLNTALYYIEASDVQFTQSVPSPTGQGAVTSIATNQGGGETYGLEADMQAAITEALTLSASYTYTHTEITKGCDDFEYALNTGGIIYNPSLGTVPECNIKGNQYPLVPETMANMALNYDAPLGGYAGLSLISNFSVSYEGSKYIQVHNLAETGATTLVNLRFGVRSDDGWQVVAFGRNLTDSDTIPMATRWFDLSTGSAGNANCATNPSASLVPCGPPATSPAGYPVTAAPGKAGGADTGTPRAFFGALRPGRTFGIEFRYDFRL
ncbi:MAG: TonB-dependent receptor [Gammaproteobacteria bacterium]|nr:TonB-dependent receptor [Gammaproteobacteria bacterium]